MRRHILDILPQPDDVTCGPTCLHAVYGFYGDAISLSRVIAETPMLEGGGTLAVHLGCHALRRGYRATIYTYNLQLFDPTWFREKGAFLRERLQAQKKVKRSPRLRTATDAMLQFLDLGGELRFEDLSGRLLRGYLRRDVPILTGLSATYLYGDPREVPETNQADDIRGQPAGHFVVLVSYNAATRKVLVADPLHPNPMARTRRYEVPVERLICSVLLGILTYDANLLILEPTESFPDGRPPRRR